MITGEGTSSDPADPRTRTTSEAARAILRDMDDREFQFDDPVHLDGAVTYETPAEDEGRRYSLPEEPTRGLWKTRPRYETLCWFSYAGWLMVWCAATTIVASLRLPLAFLVFGVTYGGFAVLGNLAGMANSYHRSVRRLLSPGGLMLGCAANLFALFLLFVVAIRVIK